MGSKKVTWKLNSNGEETKTTVERNGGTTRVRKEKVDRSFFGIPIPTSLLSEKTIRRTKG